jgi:aryl-alcohol dehydrogenase-like predicted oxidoreductase
MVPIPGTKRCRYLEENAASLDVELSTEDLARVDRQTLPPVAGDRYDPMGMSSVNR